MDVSDSASMHPELLQKAETLSAARVLRVVKPHVLRPLGLNLPPLFEGCAHLAAIPGTCCEDWPFPALSTTLLISGLPIASMLMNEPGLVERSCV